MKIVIFLLSAFVFILFDENLCILADGLIGENDYRKVQESLNELKIDSFDFEEMAEGLFKGEDIFDENKLLNDFGKNILNEFKSFTKGMASIAAIVIISAVFSNLSTGFKNNQVSETGYYITYLLLISIIIADFARATRVARTALLSIFTFVQALVPVYCIAVAFGIGVGTSAALYEGTAVLLLILEAVLVRFVLPALSLFAMTAFADFLSKEEVLSRLADFIKTIISWSLKAILGIVLGMGTLRGILSPVIDGIKKTAVVKTISAIPVVGNALNGVTETVLGTGILLKNSIGVAGAVALLIISASPMLCLLIYGLMYKLVGAVLQPTTDKRIADCLSKTADTMFLLLKTVFTGVLAFLSVIVIVAVSK